MTVVTVKGHRDKLYRPIRPDACKTKYLTNKAYAAATRETR